MRISTGPRPSVRNRWYATRLMSLRKQNSEMGNATRSGTDEGASDSGGIHTGPPLLRSALKERPIKSKWEPPTAQNDLRLHRRLPLGHCPAVGRWRSRALICVAPLRHGDVEPVDTFTESERSDRDQFIRSLRLTARGYGRSLRLSREFPLNRNLNNEIHQRRSVMTLMGPPCSAIATIWRATVSMIVLFSSWYRCRS